MGDTMSKDKLKRLSGEEVTKLFESVLDYVQVACPDPNTYKVLRSKILRVGNNCIRAIEKRIDCFDIKERKVISEEIIEVKRPR